ncbi:MAG: type I polyketide synthase, partial [Algicola sp.]|nr:type I polyketide synthase [Algicola sp.]
SVIEIPEHRLAQRSQNPFTVKYRGGFLTDVDKFDSLFFNISPREAQYLDPQERLFLETAYEAIEDAGYYPQNLVREHEPRKIGVYVGAVWAMYQMIGVDAKPQGQNLNPNSFLWSIANRVSYWMNLTGPSLTLDTACSSSLTAVHLACEAINNNECIGAIVGGVNLDLHQSKIDINQAGGALSPSGICHSFGVDANGYVASEGVGAMYLKSLARAVEDGDNIHGVIKSSITNHGGRTSGYAVPNPAAQANLVRATLDKAGIDARSIGYIEAHGTGTELGDPIEITGLTNAFESDKVTNQSCAIGSVKSNIGHTEAAAGIVGMTKVLLQMKHRELVPSLHSSQQNEFIDFANSPFYVEQNVEPWQGKTVDGKRYPLRAGISSFGAGGANAHVVIEQYEYPQKPQTEPAEEPIEQVFPLSARNEAQLYDMAVRLRGHIEKKVEQSDELPANIAHTLQIGKKSFDHRMVIMATTAKQLITRLSAFIDKQQDPAILIGHVKNAQNLTKMLNRQEKKDFIAMLSQSRNPAKLAQLWIDGLVNDWQGFTAQQGARKVSLPTYPFADKRHWLSIEASSIDANREGIHPLIDSNESTFERQYFKKTFQPQEFFIKDHVVSDIPTLPGVAYLELARKAGEVAAGRKVQSIKNIVWVSPLTVTDNTPTVALVDLKPNGDVVQFEVYSEGENGRKMLYSQGKISYATAQDIETGAETIDIQAILDRCEKVIDGVDAYPQFKSLGLDYGSAFQAIETVYKRDHEVRGSLILPSVCESEFDLFGLHPALLDSAMQVGMAGQLGEIGGEMFVPYSIGEVQLLHPLQRRCYSYVTKVEEADGASTNLSKANIFILDEQGKVLVKICESIGVPLLDVHDKPQPQRQQNVDNDGFAKLYYAHQWQPQPFRAQGVDFQDTILLFDTDDKLFTLCQQRFKQTILVQPGESFEKTTAQRFNVNPTQPQNFIQLFEALKQTPTKI